MNNKSYSTNHFPDREDDGRVVADMSQVHAGLMDVIAPTGLREIFSNRRSPRGPRAAGSFPDAGPQTQPAASTQPVDLTRGELRALLKASLKAALLLSSVFIAGAALFILFCIYVWFR